MTDFLTDEDKQNPALVEAMEAFDEAGGVYALVEDLLDLSQEASEFDPADIADDDGNPSIDCRLRYHDGAWSFLTGDSSYDQDHRGHWGASSVGVGLTRIGANSIAYDLVEQVLDSIAQGE